MERPLYLYHTRSDRRRSRDSQFLSRIHKKSHFAADSFLGMITVLIAGYVRTAGVMFAVLLLWITGELFLVSHEPDGDRMNDEARPLRILLIALYWFVFILLPLLFFCV